MRFTIGGLTAFGVLSASVALVFAADGDPASAAPPKIDFFKQVRPILAQHCFQCHGPDSAARKANLRLDLKAEALAAHDNEFAIKPGDPKASEVVERIKSAEADELMPPPKTGDKLSSKQIEVLEQWIAQGADWPEHWAFKAPVSPAIPTVNDRGWVKDPLDAFVLAKLEKEGMAPETEATRESWLRRASLDLTGIAPTPAELDAFLKDTSATAYEKQVDRLLASPRYGERQAQDWLDLARYADTGGYQRDEARSNWKWRDWVIDAYNKNMPFDQFTIEQLAGDLLPNPTLDQKIATGFNRNHPTNSEAGEEEDEYRSAYVIDRVNTTSTVFMGLTLGCAQCHDHKYDPLSQRDYYSFYSFFNNVKERDSDGFGGSNPRPSMPVPNADQAPRLADLERKIKQVEARLDAEDPLADADQREWEERMRDRLGDDFVWTTLDPTGLISRNGSILKRQDDGSILATGPTPVKDVYDVVLQPGKKRISALRIEVMPDPSQPDGSSGRASDGRFILSRLEIRNSTFSESSDPPLVYVAKADTDLNQNFDFNAIDAVTDDGAPSGIDGAIVVEPMKDTGMDGNFRGGGGWSIAGSARKEAHEAVLIPIEPLELNDASTIRVTMYFQSTQKFKSLIGRFRLSYCEDDRIRKLMLPVAPKFWASVGPFPAADAATAYSTAFAPESELKSGIDRTKKYEKPVLPPAPATDGAEGKGKGGKGPPAPEGKDASKDAKDSGESKATETALAADKAEAKKAPDAVAPTNVAPEAAAAPPVSDGAKAESEANPKDEKPAAKDGEPGGFPGKSKGGFNKEGGKFGGGFKKKLGGEDGKPAGETEGVAAKPAPESQPVPAPAVPVEAAAAVAAAPQKDVKATKKDDAANASQKDKDGKDGKGDEKKKPEKLAWTDRTTWKDGERQSLDGTGSYAYYLTRTIVCDGPRTATIHLDGPDGYRLWLNGEEVTSSEPKPKVEAKKSDMDSDNFNLADFFGGGGKKTGAVIKLGFRAGENELVLKTIHTVAAAPPRDDSAKGFGGMMFFGGGMGRRGGAGGAMTFSLDAEGDDVLNHEVAMALRREFKERSAAKAAATPTVADTAPALNTSSASGPNARDVRVPPGDVTPPAADKGTEPKVIDKAPPVKSAERDGKAAVPTFVEVKAGEGKAPPSPESGPKKPTLTPEQQRKKVIRDYFRRRISTIDHVLADELDRLKDEQAQLKKQIPESLVMDEMDKPRQAYVFKRGQYKYKTEKVSANTPLVLPAFPEDQPKNRLGLARWLVSKDHPLTARVTINRMWQQFFGVGFVKTAEDFGIRSEQPSHADLLDYLACEFVASGFDVKKMQRRIVLSATYRQASTIRPEKLEKDPENRLLSRGPHLRMTAEMIRDNALAEAGLLVEKIGGKPVKPFQPVGLWSAITGGKDWTKDADEGQYRRGLYVYWKRGVPYPSFITFDASKRETCTVSRAYTTTPLQALVLLNDPVYVEAGRMLGQRMLKEGGKEEAQRIAYGFRLCTSRLPNDAEAKILGDLLAKEREHFKADPEAVKKLLAVGDAKTDAKLDAVEVAAWAQLGSALLNLDESIRRG